jgi:Mg-chelatase subunit ChlD
MKKRRSIELFSLSFLDILSGALGAVIILFVAIPKNKQPEPDLSAEKSREEFIEVVKNKLLATNEELAKVKNELDEARRKNDELKMATSNKVESTEKGIDADIGFKFKGKKIAFVIDTSYSMYEEGRIIQVKAGIKMLLTSLPGTFQIDVIQFPFGMRAPYRAMWGMTKQFQSMNRLDSFDFISSLKPDGGTPTRDVLIYVLKNYQDLSDIVLLTDGLPTFHNSNKKDDIYEILKAVRSHNSNKVQINTIGVGSDFLSDKTSPQYQFLSLLSSESNGFFVGF